jgi:hypothetical protein
LGDVKSEGLSSEKFMDIAIYLGYQTMGVSMTTIVQSGVYHYIRAGELSFSHSIHSLERAVLMAEDQRRESQGNILIYFLSGTSY